MLCFPYSQLASLTCSEPSLTLLLPRSGNGSLNITVTLMSGTCSLSPFVFSLPHFLLSRSRSRSPFFSLVAASDRDFKLRIRGATFPKLVEKLTPAERNERDNAYITDFLLTYRMFSTPQGVLQALIQRYTGTFSLLFW